MTQVSTCSIKGPQHTNTVCNHQLIEPKLTAVIRGRAPRSYTIFYLFLQNLRHSVEERAFTGSHTVTVHRACSHTLASPKDTLQILTLPQCFQAFTLSLIKFDAFFFRFLSLIPFNQQAASYSLVARGQSFIVDIVFQVLEDDSPLI